MTRSNLIRLLKYAAAGLLIALISSYAIWRSLEYVRGPKIEVYSPTNGSETASSTITIIGRADRTNKLSLNGNIVTVDEQGNFRETLIVFPGQNAITLVAEDQFGRKVNKEIDIVGGSDFPSNRIIPVATSS
jgi:hypothetical protein